MFWAEEEEAATLKFVTHSHHHGRKVPDFTACMASLVSLWVYMGTELEFIRIKHQGFPSRRSGNESN